MKKIIPCRGCGVRFDASDDVQQTRCFYCRPGRADSMEIEAATGVRVVRTDSTGGSMIDHQAIQNRAKGLCEFALGHPEYTQLVRLTERILADKAAKPRADRIDAADARRRMIERHQNEWRA